MPCSYNQLELTNGTCIQCSFNQYPSTDLQSCIAYEKLYDKVAYDRGYSISDDISYGNTSFIIVCSVLVMVMLPGLALYYSALSNEGNIINTVLLSLTSMALISVTWLLLGYSIAFGPGGNFMGTLEWGAFTSVGAGFSATYGDKIPHVVFALFQNMFAQLTPALISGAIAGRVKFMTYAIFIFCWILVVYCPIARWVWSLKLDEGNGDIIAAGFLGELGVIDGAGGNVIHISAGFSAAAASLVIGPRLVRPELKVDVTKLLTGFAFLFFGWFGFNSGSALSANAVAGGSAVATHFATCSAILTWMVIEYVHVRHVSFTGMCSAGIIGLVTITPACLFVSAPVSLAIGAIGAICCYSFHQLKVNTRLDEWFDDADVTRDHGVAGFVGVFLTGIFADENVNGGDLTAGGINGNGKLIGYQLAAAVTCASWSFVVTAILMKILEYTVGIRVSEDEELFGLDRKHETDEAARNNALAPVDEDEPMTIVFTDVEKSSKLWSKNHSLMVKSLDRHNKVIRRVMAKYNGCEVKIIGDAFMVCFKKEFTADAIRFAADVQVELNKEEWDDEGKMNQWYQKWNNKVAEKAAAGAGGSVTTATTSASHATTVGRGGRSKKNSIFFESNDTQKSNDTPTSQQQVDASKMNLNVSNSSSRGQQDNNNNTNNEGWLEDAEHPIVKVGSGEHDNSKSTTPKSNSNSAGDENNNNTHNVLFQNNHSLSGDHPPVNVAAARRKVSVASANSDSLNASSTNTNITSNNASTSGSIANNNSSSQLEIFGVRVRCGIHTGHASIIFNPVANRYDYLGNTVGAAARIEALGHGGQTCCSREAWEAAVEQDPKIATEYIHLNLGSHTLRGIRGTTTIFQVSHPSLAKRRFPPLRVDIGSNDNNNNNNDDTRSGWGGADGGGDGDADARSGFNFGGNNSGGDPDGVVNIGGDDSGGRPIGLLRRKRSLAEVNEAQVISGLQQHSDSSRNPDSDEYNQQEGGHRSGPGSHGALGVHHQQRRSSSRGSNNRSHRYTNSSSGGRHEHYYQQQNVYQANIPNAVVYNSNGTTPRGGGGGGNDSGIVVQSVASSTTDGSSGSYQKQQPTTNNQLQQYSSASNNTSTASPLGTGAALNDPRSNNNEFHGSHTVAFDSSNNNNNNNNTGLVQAQEQQQQQPQNRQTRIYSNIRTTNSTSSSLQSSVRQLRNNQQEHNDNNNNDNNNNNNNDTTSAERLSHRSLSPG